MLMFMGNLTSWTFLITDPFASVFQGLIGPQGPIGPPGEKVSKAETEPVGQPQLCSAASISLNPDLISDSADIMSFIGFSES